MRSFTWSRAFGSGFQLIGREPAAILWWALAYIVLGVLPQFAILGGMWPMLAEIMRNAGKGQQPDMSLMVGLQAQMPLFQLIQIASSLVSTAVLLSAVYRAVLEPEQRRFGYLRLGAQELWVGITTVVLYIALILAIIALAIPAGILGFVLMRAVGGWATALVALAACGVLVWLMLRFSLATVIAFAQRKFALGESWPLTAGHAGKMFVVVLAILLIFLVAELIFAGACIGMAGGMVAATGLLGGIRDPAALLARFWPMILVGTIVTGLLGSVGFAILAAPFAEIYRELTAGEPGV